MDKFHDTNRDSGDWRVAYNNDGRTMNNEAISTLFLADIRREARQQTVELRRQTEIFRRIDERLKRNGMSLAKMNRK